MKMKLLDRLILRFGAVLTLLTGGIAVAAGILLYGHDLGEGVVMKWLPLALIISGAVAVVIGPEGGITPREIDVLREAGALPVTLGPRILRTETAGLASLAALMALWGEMEA